MLIVLQCVVAVLLISVGWAGVLICLDLGKCVVRTRLRLRFDLLDLMLLTGSVSAWLATWRVMSNSWALGPTMLAVAAMVPLLWIIKTGWQDERERRRRRLESLSAPPPATFNPPAPQPHPKRRFFKLRSRANSLLSPRISRYSLSQNPFRIDE